jgi:hypothetical protein
VEFLLLRMVMMLVSGRLIFLLERAPLFSIRGITEVSSSELKIAIFAIFVGVLNFGIDSRFLPLVPLPP